MPADLKILAPKLNAFFKMDNSSLPADFPVEQLQNLKKWEMLADNDAKKAGEPDALLNLQLILCYLARNPHIKLTPLSTGLMFDLIVTEQTEIVEAIVAQPEFDPNGPLAIDQRRRTIAAFVGVSAVFRLDMIKAFLARPELNPNINETYTGNTALHNAAKGSCAFHKPSESQRAAGQLPTLKLLLSHQAIDVNAKNKNGQTPLFLAAEAGHLDVVNELLAHPRTDASIADNNGWTPLSIAASQGNVQVAASIFAHFAQQAASTVVETATPMVRNLFGRAPVPTATPGATVSERNTQSNDCR